MFEFKAVRPVGRIEISVETADADDGFVALYKRPTEDEFTQLVADETANPPKNEAEADARVIATLDAHLVGVERLTDAKGTELLWSDELRAALLKIKPYREALFLGFVRCYNNRKTDRVGNLPPSATDGQLEA